MRNKSALRVLLVLLVFLVLDLGAPARAAISSRNGSQSALPAPNSTDKANAIALFNASPALFVESDASLNGEPVRFMHKGNGANVFLTDSAITYEVVQREGDRTKALVFRASFPGSRQVRPEGVGVSRSRFNYYLGDKTDWRLNVPTYEKVVYRDLYPGIDLVVQGLRSHLKYEFHVAAGADPRIIRVAYSGITGLSIGAKGAMIVATPLGEISDDAPFIYQDVNGAHTTIAGQFRLVDGAAYTVEVSGRYDPRRELIIDPNIGWSSFLGGSGSDGVSGITRDSEGNLYIAGWTGSHDFPTIGGWDGAWNGGYYDAFVTKFLDDGTMVWSTYFGGSDWEWAWGIAWDGGSGIYITGETASTDFPTNNGWDTSYNGDTWTVGDAFVAKFSTDGSLAWSTYLGGEEADWGYGVAANEDAVYITGGTFSYYFPTQSGWQTQLKGLGDAFVTKFAASGALVWSTYLGGGESEYLEEDMAYQNGNGIALDSAGNVYVVGETDAIDFPVLNAWNPFFSGWSDGFITKFNPEGSPVWSTYVGGDDFDSCDCAAVDGSGNLCVAGQTWSTDFPVMGAWDTSFNGGYTDCFVSRFGSDGAFLWSTYLGGKSDEGARNLAIGASDSIYVVGNTLSTNFPAKNGWDTTYNGGYGWYTSGDGFVTKLDSDGALVWSSYLGGSNSDGAGGVTTDGAGNTYVAGGTCSSNFPIRSGQDTTLGGYGDAFIAKLTEAPRTLNVSSSPITGLHITGNVPGTTNYSKVLDDASTVILRTLATASGQYAFVRWELNGRAKIAGKDTLRFTINQDSTARARYKPFRSLKILGPSTVKEHSYARYVCKLYCKDGTAYTITSYARWSDNSSYAKFTSPGLLRTYSVPANRRVRLSATYAGHTAYLYVTIRNTR